MQHNHKMLGITYNRDGYKFTAYASGMGIDALTEVIKHPDFPGVGSLGVDSWDWLTMKLGRMGAINDLPCLYSEGMGDWTLKSYCD